MRWSRSSPRRTGPHSNASSGRQAPGVFRSWWSGPFEYAGALLLGRTVASEVSARTARALAVLDRIVADHEAHGSPTRS